MTDKIVVFDGQCILCNKSLDILIRLDEDRILRYTSLQGEYVKLLDVEEGIDSIIFYDKGKLYYKSEAILKILSSLGSVWGFINIFYIIPRVIRDFIYDMIAKYRYKIFGKMESCRMPEEGDKERFID